MAWKQSGVAERGNDIFDRIFRSSRIFRKEGRRVG